MAHAGSASVQPCALGHHGTRHHSISPAWAMPWSRASAVLAAAPHVHRRRPSSACAAVGTLFSDGPAAPLPPAPAAAPPLPPSAFGRGAIGSLDSFDDDGTQYQPSADLRELVLAQLRALSDTLARFSRLSAAAAGGAGAAGAPAPPPPRLTVYARTAGSLDQGGDLQLLRIASWHGSAQAQAGAQGQGQGQQQAWREPEEVVVLRGGGGPWWESAGGGGGGLGPDDGGGFGGGACDVEASLLREDYVVLPSSASLVFPLAEGDLLVGLLVAEGAAGGGGGGDGSSAAARRGGGAAAAAGGAPLFGDDELWCLRSAAGPLAKACAMDLRAALAGAQAAARQRLARSLLREVRGPLRALTTFSAMLAPRLREGEPEGDMAAGLVTQQRRMAEVVAQLEAALRAGAAPGGRPALVRAPPPPPGALGGGGWGLEPAGAPRLAAPPGGPPVLLASASSIGSSGSSGSSSDSVISVGGADAGGECGDCRSAATAALSRSLAAAAAQGSGAAATNAAAAVAAAGRLGGGAAQPAAAWDASVRTIDIDVAQGAPSSSGPAAAGAAHARGGGPATLARRRAAAALAGRPPAGCNVLDVLSELLPAAAGLARVAGVELIAAPPLRTTPEPASAAAGGAQKRGRAPPSLLPRPVRPLLAAAPGLAVRRALSYLIDLAVQAAARGGRVAVDARAAGGGVEVSLLLTGRLQPRGGGGGGGGGVPAALGLAEQLVAGSGGRVRVMYPCELPGAGGAPKAATSVEVWWPAAAGDGGAP
ncbi:MAG: hypothetical protein J3K34DRAFT_518527 [Monoraphidium minutum]|nr:MAG: hypothetical protein J3K34DRAFT_518527 [Monoraphidium minutum]